MMASRRQDRWHTLDLVKYSLLWHIGYQLAVYELRFQAGLYMWIEIDTGYLPRDKSHTHCLIRLIELLKTLKVILALGSMKSDRAWDSRLKGLTLGQCVFLLPYLQTLLDGISVCQYVRTLPSRDPDHLLLERLRPQPPRLPLLLGGSLAVVKATYDKPRSSWCAHLASHSILHTCRHLFNQTGGIE